MIGGQDFSIFEGDTKIIEIEISSDNEEALEGARVRWVCGEIEKTGTIDNKIFSFMINPEDTIGKSGNRLRHEAKVVDNQGNVSTILRGIMEIESSIIKRIE